MRVIFRGVSRGIAETLLLGAEGSERVGEAKWKVVGRVKRVEPVWRAAAGIQILPVV